MSGQRPDSTIATVEIPQNASTVREGTFSSMLACRPKENESNQEMGLFPDCFFFSPSADRPAVLLHERSTDFFDLRSFYFFRFTF